MEQGQLDRFEMLLERLVRATEHNVDVNVNAMAFVVQRDVNTAELQALYLAKEEEAAEALSRDTRLKYSIGLSDERIILDFWLEKKRQIEDNENWRKEQEARRIKLIEDSAGASSNLPKVP